MPILSNRRASRAACSYTGVSYPLETPFARSIGSIFVTGNFYVAGKGKEKSRRTSRVTVLKINRECSCVILCARTYRETSPTLIARALPYLDSFHLSFYRRTLDFRRGSTTPRHRHNVTALLGWYSN